MIENIQTTIEDTLPIPKLVSKRLRDYVCL